MDLGIKTPEYLYITPKTRESHFRRVFFPRASSYQAILSSPCCSNIEGVCMKEKAVTGKLHFEGEKSQLQV